MNQLDEHIAKYLKDKKNPTSERSYIIQYICDSLFDDTHFKKILGQTKQFTTEEIREIFSQAKNWDKNPQALFWKLVREKQNDIKKQLKKRS